MALTVHVVRAISEEQETHYARGSLLRRSAHARVFSLQTIYSAHAVHEVTCPYCKAELEIESPLDHIFIARRACPECGREFLIKDGKASAGRCCDVGTRAIVYSANLYKSFPRSNAGRVSKITSAFNCVTSAPLDAGYSGI